MKRPEPTPWLDPERQRPPSIQDLDAAMLQAQHDPTTLRDLALERRLSDCLARLPDAPLDPRFTQRVLTALPRAQETQRPWHLLQLWTRWTRVSPQWAGAAVALLLIPLAAWQYEHLNRFRMAASVASITRPLLEVSETVQLPPEQILQDFDAIDRLRRTSAVADLELLASLGAAAEP